VPIEIRDAEPREYEAVGRVTADAYREFLPAANSDWHEYVDHIADVAGRADRTQILIAVEDGLILGSATLELDGRVEPDDDGPLKPNEAHIRMLGVAPPARGRGIAKMLMAECESRARASGRTLMTLHTTHLMKAAQSMYESLGYERGEDRTFPDGFVLMSYAKSL
jgi:ribosomal protein S18 acetylase RimI-like enzyme